MKRRSSLANDRVQHSDANPKSRRRLFHRSQVGCGAFSDASSTYSSPLRIENDVYNVNLSRNSRNLAPLRRCADRRICRKVFAVVLSCFVVFVHQHQCTVAFLPAINTQSQSSRPGRSVFPPIKTTISFPSLSSSPTLTSLFGIKGFRQWFEQQFPSAVKTVDVKKYNDTFDHVLVDMNQILHVVLRRSRTEEQAIKLLMYELDMLIQRVQPTQSLVLAIDGSPAAAKLATQRKRRFAILKNTQFKLQHLDKLQGSKRLRAKRLRTYQSELQSLQLTPGTECMQRMEAALLYWAWQRLQTQGRPNSKLLPRVRIYISTSQVPGEGEIKLLEWIHNFRGALSRNPGQSVALIGGDADLLLEAMVLPPAWTHNVFVLRPDEGFSFKASSENGSKPKKRGTPKDYMHCTTLWEMTLSLDEYCRSILPAEHYDPQVLLQIRNDLVLLLIMNGNDYLPGLVATSFRELFQCYMTLLEHWVIQHGSLDGAGLVDPNTLTFHLPFCIEFFRVLGQGAPSDKDRYDALQKSSRRTYQSMLNDMVAIGFIQGPAKYRFLSGARLKHPAMDENDDNVENESQGDDEVNMKGTAKAVEENDDFEFEDQDDENTDEFDDDDDDDDGEDADDDDVFEECEDEDYEGDDDYIPDENIDADEKVLVRLSIGQKNNGSYEMIQTWSDQSRKGIQEAKGKLAKMILEQHSLLQYTGGDENLNRMDYSWELETPAESKVDRYLAGMLWTLQTYQDGICPSYGYNYGKCVAPTGRTIEEYLTLALQEKRKVGAEELLKDYKFGGSVAAGVACLAALPTSVKNLVPEPYRQIDSGTVEETYAKCMDSNDNFFRLEQFNRFVGEELEKIERHKHSKPEDTSDEFSKSHPVGRRIIPGDHYWSVLRRVEKPLDHPFHPPPPPTEKFSPLSRNACIRATRIISMDIPRPRPGWNASYFEESAQSKERASGFFQDAWLSKHNVEVDHLDFGSLLDQGQGSLQDIPFKIAFRNAPITKDQQKDGFKVLESASLDTSAILFSPSMSPVATKKSSDSPLPRGRTISYRNLDGQSATTILNQLYDVGLVEDFVFDETVESQSSYARPTKKMKILVFGGTLRQKRIRFSRIPLADEREQATKEHLASLALNKMIRIVAKRKNPDQDVDTVSSTRVQWHDIGFGELKRLLADDQMDEARAIITNPENVTAWSMLKQLKHIGVVGTFEIVEEEKTDSQGNCGTRMILYLSSGEIGIWRHEGAPLSFSYALMRGEKKKTGRDILASQALNCILKSRWKGDGEDVDNDPTSQVSWHHLTFDEIKNQLLVQPSKS